MRFIQSDLLVTSALVSALSAGSIARAQEAQGTTLAPIILQGEGKLDPRGPVDGYVAKTQPSDLSEITVT